MDRRQFLGACAVAALSGYRIAGAMEPAAPRYKAVLFDAFAVFDPLSITRQIQRLFPERSQEVGRTFRTHLYEFMWLRALGNRYVDSQQIVSDALTTSARLLGIEVTETQRQGLVQSFLEMKAFPDVSDGLQTLRRAGVKLALVSNLSPKVLQAAIANSRLESHFDEVLSTERVNSFKPDPRAYQLGLDALHLQKDEALFVPYAAWDAAGAKWFGYPTFWLNRSSQPPAELSAVADGVGTTMAELVAYVQ